MQDLAGALKALGEPTRLRIVCLLAIKTLCVCQLMEILDLSQPKISRHLGVLKQAKLVECTKQAQWSWYSTSKHPLLKTVFPLAGQSDQAIRDRERMESLDLDLLCENPVITIGRSNDND